MRNFMIPFSALIALSAPACAEQTIGSAALIEKTVEGLSGERSMRLKVGDAVYFNELLTTGLESRGKFIFDDRATLQMGPSSQVRLDSFVYANAPAVAFNLTKGAFRFISAAGHKRYEVRTHNASVGVRGTAFAVRSTERRTDAVLYEGAIEVCLPNGGACRQLDKPCTFLAVTDAGFTPTRAVGAKDWSFDDTCRPKTQPRRRHGAAEPPASAPPPAVTPRRHAALHAAPKVRISRETSFEPPRPRRPPHRPRPIPPVYDDGPDDVPDYPPRVRRFPPGLFHPPGYGGGGPLHPRFPGKFPGAFSGSWGGHFPQGPRGGGGGYGSPMRGSFSRF